MMARVVPARNSIRMEWSLGRTKHPRPEGTICQQEKEKVSFYQYNCSIFIVLIVS